MLRPESKNRARALQLLYAWELQERPSLAEVTGRLLEVYGGRGDWAGAEALARAVTTQVVALDADIAEAAEHWRLPRMGVIERNILRIAIQEMDDRVAPPKVVITEALRLARWFAGEQAVPFVNGVLDAVARRRGLL